MQILKKDVDNYLLENKIVPHCELVAKWIKEDQQVELLTYTISILGADITDVAGIYVIHTLIIVCNAAVHLFQAML